MLYTEHIKDGSVELYILQRCRQYNIRKNKRTVSVVVALAVLKDWPFPVS